MFNEIWNFHEIKNQSQFSKKCVCKDQWYPNIMYLIYLDDSEDLFLVRFLQRRWHRDVGQPVW